MRYAPNPVKHVHVAKAVLESLYLQHNFDLLLSDCTPITICKDTYTAENLVHPGTIEVYGVKYIHAEGYPLAVIFNYVRIDLSRVRSIRMLRVENTVYNAAPLP